MRLITNEIIYYFPIDFRVKNFNVEMYLNLFYRFVNGLHTAIKKR